MCEGCVGPPSLVSDRWCAVVGSRFAGPVSCSTAVLQSTLCTPLRDTVLRDVERSRINPAVKASHEAVVT